MATESEWAERITESWARATAFQARLANGESYADAARAEGFLTRDDLVDIVMSAYRREHSKA